MAPGLVLVLIGVFLLARTFTRSDPEKVTEKDKNGKPKMDDDGKVITSWRRRNLVDFILGDLGEKVDDPNGSAPAPRAPAASPSAPKTPPEPTPAHPNP